MSRTTYHKLIKWTPQIIGQTGANCFFCKCVNSIETSLEYGHLNGKKDDSRPENLAKMCRSCNNKMKQDFDMMLIAQEQLEKNENVGYEREKSKMTSCLGNEELSPLAIMKINKPIAKLYLVEHTMNGDVILLTTAVNAITAICFSNNETGSQQAIRRYIDALCNLENGDFVLFTEVDGRKYIRRRIKN